MSVKFASLMVAVSLATVAMAAPGAQAGEARPNTDEDLDELRP